MCCIMTPADSSLDRLLELSSCRGQRLGWCCCSSFPPLKTKNRKTAAAHHSSWTSDSTVSARRRRTFILGRSVPLTQHSCGGWCSNSRLLIAIVACWPDIRVRLLFCARLAVFVFCGLTCLLFGPCCHPSTSSPTGYSSSSLAFRGQLPYVE